MRKLNLRIKNIENRQFGIFENAASFGGESSITFVHEITKQLFLLEDEIKQSFFYDGDSQACTYTWKPFTANSDDLPVRTSEQRKLIDVQ